jgi:hypothetical protein
MPCEEDLRGSVWHRLIQTVLTTVDYRESLHAFDETALNLLCCCNCKRLQTSQWLNLAYSLTPWRVAPESIEYSAA